MTTIYGFAGIAKLHREWIDGSTLLAYAEDGLFTERAGACLRAHDILRVSAAWATMIAELAVAAALFVRRVRTIALATAIAMHLTFELVARPDVIGWVMISLLLGCAGAAAKERRLDRLGKRESR